MCCNFICCDITYLYEIYYDFICYFHKSTRMDYETYQRTKVRARPRIYIKKYKKGEVKFSRAWKS